MNGIYRTKHFERRCQQRSIRKIVVETLLQYGLARRTRGGAETLTFTKDALKEIRVDLGDAAFRSCDKLRNAYIVLAYDGSAITAARSFRRNRI